MSNLLKKGSTISKSERVIDYNEVIKAKLQMILNSEERAGAEPDGFVHGLNAEVVEALIAEDDTDEHVNALSGEQAAFLQETQEQARQLIEDANQQAEQILADARTQAEAAYSQAKVKGYEEGKQEALQELARQQAELNQQFEAQCQQLEQEYEELRKKLEPELVDVLTDVFKKVTLTVAEDNQQIILHLINGVMHNAETSREFTIKASPEDYQFLIGNQGKIYCALTREVTMDIVEDSSLKRNECIVETDGGVFNCSLDIELENLIKEIKLLSCI